MPRFSSKNLGSIFNMIAIFLKPLILGIAD